MFQFLGSTARCCVVLAGLCLALGCSDRGIAALREDAGVDSDARGCPAEAGESPIALATPSGTIFGTLRLPAGCEPYSIALIIAGSGPTDRDGNQGATLRTDAYALLAQHLADRGVASVRYDKRGVGASFAAGPSESDLRFETYVDDAAAWLMKFDSDARFGTRIVIGHSEGALLGVLALQKVPALGYLSLAGAGRPAGELLREQIAKSPGLDAADVTRANQILDELEAGREVAAVPAEFLGGLFRASIQPYLISWFKYDPAAELQKLALPALLAQGTTDIQVSVADADLLAAARPDAQELIVDGMCHVLKLATLDPADQNRAYTDPTLPLADALAQGIDGFLDTTLMR